MNQVRRRGWPGLAVAVALLGLADASLAAENTILVGEPWLSRAHSGLGQGAWLGVTLADVSAERASELDLPGAHGALVEEVTEDSPAQEGGLEAGDVILTFDGDRVRSVSHLVRLVKETPVGRTVEVVIGRDGRKRTLEVSVGKRPSPPTSFSAADVFAAPRLETGQPWALLAYARPRLGIDGVDLGEQLAAFLAVAAGEGVLVREVKPDSAAERAGLRAGDVIVRVDDEAIASVSELRGALRRSTGEDRRISLGIVRDRREQTLEVELEESRSDLYGEAWESYGDTLRDATRKWREQHRDELQKWRRQLRDSQRQYRDILKSIEGDRIYELAAPDTTAAGVVAIEAI